MSSVSPRPSFVTVPPTSPPGLTVMEFLSGHFPHIVPELWQKRFRENKVFHGNDRPADPFSLADSGMEFKYFREVDSEPGIAASHTLLFRDEHIIVACKPHFQPVVPGGKFVNACLLYRLMEETGLPELSPVHRIDRHTAGLVLFSVNEKERAAYQSLFKSRQVEKEYHANVQWLSNPPPGDSFDLESRIEKRGTGFLQELVEGTPNAFCRIRVVERSGSFAALTLNPQTGKKHQLRLQVSQIGARMVNDPFYPVLSTESPDDSEKPLQLLSKHLCFRDPHTLRELSFSSPRALIPLGHGHQIQPLHEPT
jgi:tRNA pseudouridine32 synthase / 23S rRNA pseudouridine746 synthase